MSSTPSAGDPPTPESGAIASSTPAHTSTTEHDRGADFPMVVFLAAATTIGAHTLFYHLAPSIWRKRSATPVSDYLPWKSGWVGEGDGIESPVLMLFTVAVCVLTLAAAALMARLARRVTLPLHAVLPIFFVAFATAVGLDLPVENPQLFGLKTLAAQGAALALVALWTWVARFSSQRPTARFHVRWLSELAVLAVVVPFSFTAVETWRTEEWGYFLSPALQIIDGAALDSLYLQYDLFPTLIGVLWIKLGLSVEHFHVFGQFTWPIFFVGLFAFAKRLFSNAPLASYLVCAVFVARIFGAEHDPTFYIQTTPLRLDLWLLVVAIAYLKGPTHVALGATVGLLVLFFRSMGLLVLASFLAFVAIDVVCVHLAEPKSTRAFVATARRQLRAYVRNLAIVACFTLLATIVFGNFLPPALTDYHEHTIGFMKTSPKSFLWWVILAYAVLATLWGRCQGDLAPRSRQAILFFMILGLSHLTYFTGRSHEHNLLSLTGSIFFAVFLAVDLALFRGASQATTRLLRFFPAIFLAFVVHGYSGRLVERVETQSSIWAGSAGRHRPELPDPACHVVEQETRGVGKVLFFSKFDFQFYHACKKVPQGRSQPLEAHILRSKLAEFLRDFLRAGNTIVVPRAEEADYRDGANRLAMRTTEVISGPFIFVRDGTPK